MTEGLKFDSDKPMMSLLPPFATLAVGRVLRWVQKNTRLEIGGTLKMDNNDMLMQRYDIFLHICLEKNTTQNPVKTTWHM